MVHSTIEFIDFGDVDIVQSFKSFSGIETFIEANLHIFEYFRFEKDYTFALEGVCVLKGDSAIGFLSDL